MAGSTARRLRAIRHNQPAAPRLRANLPASLPEKIACAIRCAALCMLQRSRSSRGREQSDEPFRIRDVQFNYPQIAVLTPAPINIFLKFLRIFGIVAFYGVPQALPVQPRHPFINI